MKEHVCAGLRTARGDLRPPLREMPEFCSNPGGHFQQGTNRFCNLVISFFHIQVAPFNHQNWKKSTMWLCFLRIYLRICLRGERQINLAALLRFSVRLVMEKNSTTWTSTGLGFRTFLNWELNHPHSECVDTKQKLKSVLLGDWGNQLVIVLLEGSNMRKKTIEKAQFWTVCLQANSNLHNLWTTNAHLFIAHIKEFTNFYRKKTTILVIQKFADDITVIILWSYLARTKVSLESYNYVAQLIQAMVSLETYTAVTKTYHFGTSSFSWPPLRVAKSWPTCTEKDDDGMVAMFLGIVAMILKWSWYNH